MAPFAGFLLFLPFLAAGSSSAAATPPPKCFTSLFSFGDSATATGIQKTDNTPGATAPHCAFPPYGESFFDKPTGRCSDGRNIVDFLSQYLRLPLLPPYWGEPIPSTNNPYSHGANLAVVSATALDSNEMGGSSGCRNCSLPVQIRRFKILINSLHPTPAKRRAYLKKSLILLGEIGGVDYQRASFRNTTTSQSQVEELIPLVTKQIGSVIEDLIEFGAVNFVVPGDFPKGCFPSYLTKFQSSNRTDYEPRTGCLVYHNRFSARHNALLKREIDRIGKAYRKVSIRYADYYSAGIRMHRDPEKYGIVRATMNKACCGAGGPYNYNPAAVCGRPGAVACENPKAYIKWDDHHYTEAANRVIAGAVFNRRFRYRAACRD